MKVANHHYLYPSNRHLKEREVDYVQWLHVYPRREGCGGIIELGSKSVKPYHVHKCNSTGHKFVTTLTLLLTYHRGIASSL